jgi:ligand-binding SRPBCC domain-containing protein
MIQQLVQQQWLPISLPEAWHFFATPKNLNLITPPGMSFVIKNELPDEMYEGLLIQYTIRPFLNIPFNWLTEITHIKPQQYFIDEQRFGPYKLWHHEHHFKEENNGVFMTDLLNYDIGKSVFGRIAGGIYVHKQIKNIFAYRTEKLNAIFPSQ